MHDQCETVRRHLSASLDGELSQFEHALVADHLARCPACSAFAASVTRLTSELRNAPLEPFERTVSVRTHRHPAWSRLAPAVAALAVIGAGLGSLLSTASLQLPFASGTEEPTARAAALPVNRLILSDLKRTQSESRASAFSKAPQRAGGKIVPTAPQQ